MPEHLSLSKFFGFCLVTIGIILVCIIFGGYTNFYRAQNRIEASKTYLSDACRYRIELLPGLVEIAEKSGLQTSALNLSQAIETATSILQQVVSEKTPLGNDLTKELERSQTELTRQLKIVFNQLETSLDKRYSQQFTTFKKEFIPLQDHLYVTRKRYNEETEYFINRTITFPSSLFAKLFGFNKFKYIKLSKDVLLPYEMAFTPQSS